MQCSLCQERAVMAKPQLCRDHFTNYFEKRVKDTISEYSLLDKEDKVAVAVSGGKDSMTVLAILHELGYDVHALAIDEGIEGYRDGTLKTLKAYCRKEDIPLKVVSFEDEVGHGLDQILQHHDMRPCTVCGVLRRYYLNEHAKGYSVIATGHNMDDEAQAVLMNLLKGNTALLRRMGPVSGTRTSGKFTKRVKPLFLCPEKEVMIYSYLKGLTTDFKECPNVRHAFRLKVRDQLNALERKQPGAKKNLIKWFLENVDREQQGTIKSFCSRCGQPSTQDVCNACRYIEKIKSS